MQTKIENGTISCDRFGQITGIDCTCIRDAGCKGCFIFESEAITISEFSYPILVKSLNEGLKPQKQLSWNTSVQ